MSKLAEPVEFEHSPRKRKRRRRSSADRWARAMWPALPLVAAMLLSVGVIQIVESGPVPTPGQDPVSQTPAAHKAAEHLDVDLFEQGVFWDPSRLQRVSQEQRGGILLTPDASDASAAEAPRQPARSEPPPSFLGEDVEALGVRDPNLLEFSIPAAPLPAPELSASGLGDLQ